MEKSEQPGIYILLMVYTGQVNIHVWSNLLEGILVETSESTSFRITIMFWLITESL